MPPTMTGSKGRAEAVEPLDIYLGERLRQAREMRGWRRDYLASQLGVTTQAIEKYETGKNRMFANRLWALSRSLGMDYGWFFEGFDPLASSTAKAGRSSEADLLTRPNMEVLQRYVGLDEVQQRVIRQVLEQFTRANEAEFKLAEAGIDTGGDPSDQA